VNHAELFRIARRDVHQHFVDHPDHVRGEIVILIGPKPRSKQPFPDHHPPLCQCADPHIGSAFGISPSGISWRDWKRASRVRRSFNTGTMSTALGDARARVRGKTRTVCGTKVRR